MLSHLVIGKKFTTLICLWSLSISLYWPKNLVTTKQPHWLTFIYKSSRSAAAGGSIAHERTPRPQVIFSQKSMVSRSSVRENSPSGTLQTRALWSHVLNLHDPPVSQIPEQQPPSSPQPCFPHRHPSPRPCLPGSSLWPREESLRHFERFTVLWVTHGAEGKSSRLLLSSSNYAENVMAPFEIIGRWRVTRQSMRALIHLGRG